MHSKIDYRRIGRHFRVARQQLNLKQKDVAELLGVSVKTYSNMERGAQELSLYRIIQLCQLLKLKPGCVLDDCNDELLALETLPETVCEAKKQLRLFFLPSLTPEHHGTASSILYYSSESHNGIHSN